MLPEGRCLGIFKNSEEAIFTEFGSLLIFIVELFFISNNVLEYFSIYVEEALNLGITFGATLKRESNIRRIGISRICGRGEELHDVHTLGELFSFLTCEMERLRPDLP